jgi:hypothetical protein
MLKECNYALKKDTGKWLDIGKERGMLENKEVDSYYIKKLRETIEILLNSDNISDETKLWLSDKNMNFNKVNEQLNMVPSKKKMSYSSTVLRVNTDEKKLVDLVGVDWLRELMYGYLDKDSVESGLGRIISVYGKFDERRNALAFEISKDKIGNPYVDENGTLNSEDFFSYFEDISKYLKSRISIFADAINSDSDFVSYFNYLLSVKGMQDEKVTNDRLRLIAMLEGNDWNSDEIDNSESNDDEIVEYMDSDI